MRVITALTNSSTLEMYVFVVFFKKFYISFIKTIMVHQCHDHWYSTFKSTISYMNTIEIRHINI